MSVFGLLTEQLQLNVVVNRLSSYKSKATVKYAFGRMSIASQVE